MLNPANVYLRIRRSPWSFTGLVVGLTVSAFLAGAGWAAHGGHHAKPLPPGLWQMLEFSTSPLLVVLAVDQAGAIQPYYHQTLGKPAEYEDIQNPLSEPKVEMKIGNPKVCWKTSGGDEQCVVY
jgi:hypothetical protein